MKKYYLLATTALVASFCVSRAMAETTSLDIPVKAEIVRPCTIGLDSSEINFGTIAVSSFTSGDGGTITLGSDGRLSASGLDIALSGGTSVADLYVDCNPDAIVKITNEAGTFMGGNGYFTPIISTYTDGYVTVDSDFNKSLKEIVGDTGKGEFLVTGELSLPSNSYSSTLDTNIKITLEY